MIMLGEYPVIDLPQNWARSCKYALTGKYGRADNLLGAEDRVSYSHTPRRTYQYSVMARNAAERMNLDTIVRQALAVKKAAVPIWAKARYDFIRADLVFTFTGTPPAVGTNWLLYSAAAGVSVLTVSEVAVQIVTFAVVEDSNGGDGLHGGDLVPLLCGYIQKPKGNLIGGDAGKLDLSFVQNDFVQGSGGVVVGGDDIEGISYVKKGEFALVTGEGESVYINTEIIPQGSDTSFDLYTSLRSASNGNIVIGVSDPSAASPRAYLGYLNATDKQTISKGWGGEFVSNPYGVNGDTDYHAWSKRGDTFLFDEASYNSPDGNYNGSFPLYLFAFYVGGSFNAYIESGISYFSFAFDSTLSNLFADMFAVPEGRIPFGGAEPAPSDCMWDNARQRFFEVEGSGTVGIEVLA